MFLYYFRSIKVEKKIYSIFIVIFFGLVLIPIITFDVKDEISTRENRTLQPFPKLFVDGEVNNIFSDLNNYFEDRFGGREYLIKLNNYINYELLKGSYINQKAVKGKENWWFYINSSDGDNRSDFYKKNLMTAPELDAFSLSIENTLKWCNAQNISCIFLIGPNKHSVYSEFYPFERPTGQTRADQLVSVLEDAGASYIFPRDILISKKSEIDIPLYYETDTHWNPLGAFVAYEQLLNMLKEMFPNQNFPEIQYDTKIEYSTTAGDILPMLAIENSKSTQPKLIPQGIMQAELYTYIKNDGRNGVHTMGADKTAPRALVFGDSFFTALEPFVSPLFSETEYIGKNFSESDKEYVLEYKPDIIIFESVERHLPSICSGIK